MFPRALPKFHAVAPIDDDHFGGKWVTVQGFAACLNILCSIGSLTKEESNLHAGIGGSVVENEDQLLVESIELRYVWVSFKYINRYE